MGQRSLSVYWDLETWARARSGFVAQLDDEAAATTLLDWIKSAIHAHADLTAHDRARVAGTPDPATGGVRRVHQVPAELLDAIDTARRDDRVQAGRVLSRSQWIRGAAVVAADLVEQLHGSLPDPPATLPTGPAPTSTA